MDVVLLTSPGGGPRSVAALARAHRDLGHRVRVVDVRELTPVATSDGVDVALAADVVHARVSRRWAWPAQRAVQAAGLVCVNPLEAVVAGRDKWVCHLALAAAGLPTPATALLLPGADPAPAVAAVGGYPVVTKVLAGHSGDGVELVTADLQPPTHEPLLVQRLVAEAVGWDVRVDVVAGRIATRTRRTATRPGQWRANVALGATTDPLPPDRGLEELAVAAAEACGLVLAGVDLLHTGDGWTVVEVNTNAGVAGVTALDDRPLAQWHAEAVAAAVP